MDRWISGYPLKQMNVICCSRYIEPSPTYRGALAQQLTYSEGDQPGIPYPLHLIAGTRTEYVSVCARVCVCTPHFTACLDTEGVLRPADSHWTSEDGCHQFTCNKGQVMGLTKLCVHVLLPNCTPHNVEGQCCPAYNCTSDAPRGEVTGRTYQQERNTPNTSKPGNVPSFRRQHTLQNADVTTAYKIILDDCINAA